MSFSGTFIVLFSHVDLQPTQNGLYVSCEVKDHCIGTSHLLKTPSFLKCLAGPLPHKSTSCECELILISW